MFEEGIPIFQNIEMCPVSRNKFHKEVDGFPMPSYKKTEWEANTKNLEFEINEKYLSLYNDIIIRI